MKKLIYLDHSATTPLLPDVREAMLLDAGYNPSSVHAFGREGRSLLTKARKTISSYLKIRPSELIFTSSGTESLNTLISSFPSKKIITTPFEHAAVIETINHLGTAVSYDLNDRDGDLIIVSAVNGETGTMLDLEEIASLAEDRGIPLIVDGVALLGKEIFSIPSGVTGMAFSAHKMHGPKGCGAFFLRASSPFSPLFVGGPQEFGKRAGTENLAGILGFAKAVEMLPSSFEPLRSLRDHFEKRILSLGGVFINGEGKRVSNISNLYFEGIDGETLLINLDLDGVMASHGSACSAGALEPSRILLSMGYSSMRAANSIRFSFSRLQIDEAADLVIKHVRLLQSRTTNMDPLPA